jgi:hypothetical protein
MWIRLHRRMDNYGTDSWLPYYKYGDLDRDELFHYFQCTTFSYSLSRPSRSLSYGSYIYNYLCNECISPLTFCVRIPLMASCTRYNIVWSSLSVHCSSSVVFCGYSSFLYKYNWPPRYSWNIVERFVKHHNSILFRNLQKRYLTYWGVALSNNTTHYSPDQAFLFIALHPVHSTRRAKKNLCVFVPCEHSSVPSKCGSKMYSKVLISHNINT